MPKLRILLSLSALVLTVSSSTFAVERLQNMPNPYPYPGRYPAESYRADLAPAHPGEFNPFIDHDRYETDYQFFAPVEDEVDYFGGIDKPNIGWFFDYRRLYWNVSRPETALINAGGDNTWGNQINLGYWTDKDHGWLVEFVHVDGPTDQSNNNANFTTIEFDKTYRTDILRKPGDSLEVFAGGRFVDFTDRSAAFPRVNPPFPSVNKVVQGVLGTRFRRRHGQWLLSLEGRLSPGVNFWGTAVNNGGNASGFGGNYFCYSFDFRAVANYQITRDLALSFGAEYQAFPVGITRDSRATQSYLGMGGGMFGFTYNR